LPCSLLYPEYRKSLGSTMPQAIRAARRMLNK
jgi:hypothetical protein